MQTWTAEELRRFLDHVARERLAALWTLAASTGMRRGEVLGLRWVDVDLDRARVAVRQTLVVAGRQVITSEPKTSRGRRSIALDPRTVTALRTWRAAQLEERLAWGPAYRDSGLVFTREDGAPLHPEWLSDAFAWRIKTAGLPRSASTTCAIPMLGWAWPPAYRSRSCPSGWGTAPRTSPPTPTST
jgi:integrase